MKKFFLFAVIFLTALMSTSALAATQKADYGAIIKDLQTKVADAEKNGAKWDQQQWYDAFTYFLKECRPLFETLKEMSDRIDNNPNEALTLAAELSEYEKEFNELTECFDRFEKAAKATTEGNKIISNNDYANKIMIDAGFSQELIEMILSDKLSDDHDIDWDKLEASHEDDEPIVGSEVEPLMAILEEARTQGKNWSEQKWEDTFVNVYTKLQPMMALMAQIQNLDDKNSENENLLAAINILTEVSDKYGSADTLIEGLEEAARATQNGAKVVGNEERMLNILERAGWDKEWK